MNNTSKAVVKKSPFTGFVVFASSRALFRAYLNKEILDAQIDAHQQEQAIKESEQETN